jgi:hypothetical protein
MLLIGLPRHDVALGSDNLRRTISSGADRLGFIEFNRLPVIDIDTECLVYSVEGREAG